MLFNSPTFFFFLIITFIVYYISWFKKQQLLILIVASLIFYSFERVEFVLLLLLSAMINILSSYFVVYGNNQNRKIIAVSGLTLNIILLIFFKYSPLLSQTLFPENSSIGEFLLYIPLPIGISFFTFEGISLVVDVWKEKYCKGETIVSKSLAEHAKKTIFFISFFPHLIAGPILKAHDFYPQISCKLFKDIDWESAFKSLIVGYFLKMVVADNLKDFTMYMAYPNYETQSSLTLLSYVWAYSCQIFADFAGYSLIAIGLGMLFGYSLNKNFNFPYISISFKEFWKRWHISLSTFLMEYLYFPLGGNRKGKWRTYFNLVLTMTIGGLWHGVGWTYALWGLLHGLILGIERFFLKKDPSTRSVFSKIISVFFVFWTVSFFWLFFKIPNIEHVLGFMKNILTNVYMENYTHLDNISAILIYSSPVVLYHLAYILNSKKIFFKFFKKIEPAIYGILIFLSITNSGTIDSFIYFQF